MFKIVKKKVLNPTVSQIVVEAPYIAKKAEPGQFIILRIDEQGERIPFTIADFDRVLSLSLIEKADARREELKKQNVAAGAFTIVSESGETDAEVEAKIQARQDAKKAKNYAEADRIRDELKAAGIELTDIPHGVTWKRI